MSYPWLGIVYYAFLLIAGILFAWRFSKSLPEHDWALFNLWAFLGAAPYRDHQQIKPPGINLWYWLITRVVGKDVQRVRFAHHLLINLGALVALYAWGLPAGLTWLVLMNAAHFLCFAGNVEAPTALFLTICLAAPNPWAKVIAFSIACLFNFKVLPMAIILWPHVGETLVVLGTWGGAFLGFCRLKPDVARPMLWALAVEAGRVQKRRHSLGYWIRNQYLKNNVWYQGYGIAILWGGLAIYNRPDLIFWLPCILYLALCLTGKLFGIYHFMVFVPWIALAIPDVLPLLLLISFAQLAWSGFYAPDLYLTAYLSQKDVVRWAKEIGKRLEGKSFWCNCWAHMIYIYADVFPKYGIELQCGALAFEEWKRRRNELLERDPPKYVVLGWGGDSAVKVRTRRAVQIGEFQIAQLAGHTEL